MEEKQVLKMLGALSQETRLGVIRYLVKCDPEGAPAGDIGREVAASSSRISFHLSALENAGLVSSERVSRNIIYRAEMKNVGNLISFLLDDCCSNHPDILSCCSGTRGRC